MDYLTAPLLRELIDHINVFETEGTGKNRTQRIVIYYRFVGYIDIPAAPLTSHYTPQPTPFDMECFTDNPLKEIIKVDMIDAQRGFADPDSPDGGERAKRQLSDQMRSYYDKHLNPEKSPSLEDLDILKATEDAEKAFNNNLAVKFAPAIHELESLGYPGIADPKLTIVTKMTTSETLKHDSVVQYALSKNDNTLKLPEKYNGLGYQNLISIRRKKERLEKIEMVKKFSYNPNGDNVGYDSLSHSEVIKMSTDFIMTEPTMQNILVAKYPILLIDESQDTKKELIDALLDVCEKHKSEFIVGMFGDTMQRIYNDGKENLAGCIPDDWAKPTKVMNHRSATRIVELANAIRSTIDGQKQKARSDANAGIVRLFISSTTTKKDDVEERIAQRMAIDTGDDDWKDKTAYKSLILEHHMAASRFGFSNLYTPLNESGKFDTALRDGSIAELSILAKMVLPLVKAYQERNDFEVAKIVRKYSPLLDKKTFAANIESQAEMLQNAENAIESLMELWSDDKQPSCLDVLRSVRDTGLFEVSSRVDDLLAEQYEGENQKIIALRAALSASFSELESYSLYVTDNTRFATHQGVKGLEYPRVMVIMDDAQARGFLFSYEKLFGAKAKTDTDLKNEREGKDTSITRTARLFYVACTRAQDSARKREVAARAVRPLPSENG